MSNPGIYSLFVYGSLRSGFNSPAYEYVSRYFSLVSEAKVKGRIYDMGTYAAGLPAADEAYITGELYHIKNPNEFSWAIGQLDDYEGIGAEADEIDLFRRDSAEVITPGGSTLAWIYWYNGDVSGRPVIASGDMIEYLKHKI